MPSSAERSLTLKLKEDRSGNALLTAARDLDKLAQGADNAGGSFQGMGSDAEKLNAQIVESTARVKDLQTQIARTGDRGLFGDLKKEQRFLDDLKKLSLDFGDGKSGMSGVAAGLAADAAAAGTKVGGSFVGGITSAFDGAGPAIKIGLIGGLVGAGVAFAPMLGAIVSGAVLGAVGTGGIVGGIVAAAHDSSVKEEWGKFTENLTSEAFGKHAFVGPVKEGIVELGKAFEDLDIGAVLSKGADSVPVLAKGIGDLARNIMPGFNDIMDKSGETSAIMADGFGMLGASLSDFLSEVAGSSGTMDGLRSLFALTSGAIEFTGNTINVLSDTYHGFLNVTEQVSGALADFYGDFPILGATARDLNSDMQELMGTGEQLEKRIAGITKVIQLTNQGFDPFIAYLDEARERSTELAVSLDTLFGAQMSVSAATLSWNQNILQLKESVNEHGNSLDSNTEKGLANQAMIQGLIGDAVRIREATLAQTKSTDAANKAYMDQINVLKTLMEKLGFTKAEIDKLVGQYDITIMTHFKQTGSAPKVGGGVYLGSTAWAAGEVGHRASGGPMRAGNPYWVGEEGPELVVPKQDGYVLPNSGTSGAGSAMRGGPLAVRLSWAGSGQRLVDAIMEALRIEVQGLGGPVAAFS